MTGLLAYGGWKSASLGSMFLETLPHFTGGLLASLVPYVVLSLAVDALPRYRWAPAILFLLYEILVVLPRLAVMGEFGPAHVAVSFTGLAAAVFPLLLAGKVVVLEWSEHRRGKLGRQAEPTPDGGGGPAAPSA